MPNTKNSLKTRIFLAVLLIIFFGAFFCRATSSNGSEFTAFLKQKLNLWERLQEPLAIKVSTGNLPNSNLSEFIPILNFTIKNHRDKTVLMRELEFQVDDSGLLQFEELEIIDKDKNPAGYFLDYIDEDLHHPYFGLNNIEIAPEENKKLYLVYRTDGADISNIRRQIFKVIIDKESIEYQDTESWDIYYYAPEKNINERVYTYKYPLLTEDTLKVNIGSGFILNNDLSESVPILNFYIRSNNDETIIVENFTFEVDNRGLMDFEYLSLIDEDKNKINASLSYIEDNKDKIRVSLPGGIRVNPNEFRVVNLVWNAENYPISKLQRHLFKAELPQDAFTYVEESNEWKGYSTPRNRTRKFIYTYKIPSLMDRLLENAITQDEETEKIVFAINQAAADNIPNYEANIQNFVNKINEFLSQNTRKQLILDRIMTYPDDAFRCEIDQHREYFVSNNSFGGITIIYFVGNIDEEPYSGCHTGNAGFTREFDELDYGLVFLNDETFEGEDLETTEIPRESSLHVAFHELGHTYGLGQPEWYLYLDPNNPPDAFVEDKTEIEPIILPYTISETEINDPMFGRQTGNYQDYTYSSINAKIVNHNANHYFSLSDIAKLIPKKIITKVTANGVAVHGAKVNIYGIKPNCIMCYGWDGDDRTPEEKYPLLRVAYTNQEGEAHLPATTINFIYYEDRESPSFGFTVNAVKVYKDGLMGGGFYSTLDLHRTKILEEEDEFVLNIELN